MTTLARLILLISAPALIGGCGGPEVDLGSGPGPSIPPGGYEQAAGAICEEVARGFAEIQAEEPRTFAQGDEVVGALLGVAREGEEQLGSLDPPADRAAAFRRYLVARAEVIAQLERARDAAGAEDGAGYERARRAVVEAAAERARLARAAGLPACARTEAG